MIDTTFNYIYSYFLQSKPCIDTRLLCLLSISPHLSLHNLSPLLILKLLPPIIRMINVFLVKRWKKKKEEKYKKIKVKICFKATTCTRIPTCINTNLHLPRLGLRYISISRSHSRGHTRACIIIVLIIRTHLSTPRKLSVASSEQ